MLRTDLMRVSLACRALLVLIAVQAVGAGRADAGETEAAAHFATASKAFERAEFETAAREFELAYSEAPHPAPLYNAGLAWFGANRMDHAADVLSVALSMEGLSAEQKLDATRRLEAAEKQLAILKLSGVSADSKVRVDKGPTLPATARIHGSLGRHEVHAVDSDGGTMTRTITVEKADGSELAVSFESAEPVAPAASRSFDPKLALGLGLLGGAVVFGVAAIGTGVAGLDARDEYVAALGDARAKDERSELRDDAVSLKVSTNVLWGFAAATLIGGGVLTGLYLFGPNTTTTAVRITPGGVVVDGRF
jgi:hypothetical protein